MGPGTEEGLALCSAQTGTRSICHPLPRYWMIFCQWLPSLSEKAEEVDPEEEDKRRKTTKNSIRLSLFLSECGVEAAVMDFDIEPAGQSEKREPSVQSISE